MSEVSSINSNKDTTTSVPLQKIPASSKPTARAYLQVFGSGNTETGPSVYLFADSQRYVFNCGEMTQRLFHESKLKLGKIKNIFLTQICWEFVGGLPGLFLTLRDAGKSSLNVHGPSNLLQLFHSSKPFLSTQNMDLSCVCYSEESMEKFEDENVIVWPVVVQAWVEQSNQATAVGCLLHLYRKHIESHYEQIFSDLEEVKTEDFSYNSEITVIKEQYENIESDRESEETDNGQDINKEGSKEENPKRCKLEIHPRNAVSYICQLVSIPGKMKIDKAKALGVPKGPLLGLLQAGNTITLENGSVVRPEDVMEKPPDDCVFCIIDCPSQDHFKKLAHNPLLSMHKDGGTKPQPSVVVHFSAADVVNTSEYSNWITSFGSTCQHLFLNCQMSPPKMSMLSQLGIQYNLHQLNADIFPRLFASDKADIEIHQDDKQNRTAGESFLIFHLRPAQKVGYDRSDIETRWDIMAEKARQRQLLSTTAENCTLEEIKNSMKDFIDPRKFSVKPNISNERTLDDALNSELKIKDENFEIVFLGTGAALPSKYRNVSCTLVKISKEKIMLLDCGEGTYGQLFRHYGPQLKNIILQLRCVFVSHIHADHHLGLIRILRTWQTITQSISSEERPEPILVVGPPSVLHWLRAYGTFCETLHLRFLDSTKLRKKSCWGYEELSSLLESKVTIVPVDHCFNSFGLVLTHNTGWKLVYSGDTRPCENLTREGQEATVLIHEATLEDDLHDEALTKQHSTTTEAIKCGQDMKAKFVLLNHFSQRYPKIPVFNEKFSDCTGITFDHMTVNVRNISSVPKLLKSLKEIFKEEIEEQNMSKSVSSELDSQKRSQDSVEEG